MKNILLFTTFFYLVFFGFAFLLDSALEKESAFNETRQARIECIESGLGSECNFK